MTRLTVLGRLAIAVTSASLALLALPGVAPAAPDDEATTPTADAQAEPVRPELCPSDSLCSWPTPDFTGEITEIPDLFTAGCHSLPRAARSAMNDTGLRATFHTETDYAGEPVIEVAPGAKATSFLTAKSVRLSAPAATTPSPGPDRDTTPDTDADADEPRDTTAQPATRGADG